MKRVRPGQIQDGVHDLLKRRHHAASPDTMPRTRSSLRQVALSRALTSETSATNAVTYTSLHADVTSCDLQYAKLRRYITEAGPPYKHELYDLLYPIFIHVFLELVINGHRVPAHKFFDRYHDQVVDQTGGGGGGGHKDRQRIIDTLRHTHMREDVINNQLLAAFREHKYVVFMKSETLDYLLRYLRSQDNVLLMHMFNQYLSVQVRESSSKVDVPPQEPGLHNKPADSPDKRRHRDVSMTSLHKCIERVRAGAPCVSGVCYYTLINSTHGLCCCSVSPDRRLLAAGSENSNVKLWALTPELLPQRQHDNVISHVSLGDDDDDVTDDVRTGRCEVVNLRGHSGPVYATRFMPDSQFLLSSSEDATVRLWSADSTSNLVTYTGHNYPVWGLDVSGLGYFASCGQDKSVRLWTTDRTFPIRTFVGHGMDVDSVKFHPNGNYLASGSDDKTIRLWSVQEGKCVRLLQAHRSSVYALAFSPDGQWLASAGEDRRIRVWDLASGHVVRDLRGHTDMIYSLTYSRDGAMLASGGLDSTLRVWDMTRPAGTHTSHEASTRGHDTSPELLASFPTKTTSVLHLHYGPHNVLYGAGGALS